MTITTVVGGYRLSDQKASFFVGKNRRCTCGRANCAHVRAVANYLRGGGQRAPERTQDMPRQFDCPVCGAPAHGSLEANRWECSANPQHFWAWWVERLQRKQAEARADWSPYTTEVMQAFASNAARAAFVESCKLNYAAQA